MREIADHAELLARYGEDTLCRWVAQAPDGRGRAWHSPDGRAVAVARPALSRRDRLAVSGPPEAAVPLVRAVLAEVGPTFRPLGDRALIEALVDGIPELAAVGAFGWMDCQANPEQPAASGPATIPGRPATPDKATTSGQPAMPGQPAASWHPGATDLGRPGPGWLGAAALPEVAVLMAHAFPSSHAKPGAEGVERWAGVRGEDGRLLAVAALAWSAPTVGLISGVAVDPAARGRGLGRAICSFLLGEALAGHGTAALMVGGENHTARQLYRSLGMRHRAVAAAAITTA
ncbi:GCN5-related N-acetyltransferase [Kitasatospora sp. MMS16-BH015]|uniref:GNAT family N-acetyltransferase n=1 Tax=Kitasatospora sp. MMS16-BH015 TaxID=2018025 RepID=UPI000CA20D0E|nr:GNAT family N-acetyltransferase [Kitasatospora sp. MMS16-BH015]AUG80840.1 GCN5-related N-acetyltransferase [Kitasatospora sp. MMS16-BH015]